MTTRRDFLKTTAVAAGSLALAANVHAAGDDTIKVGIVGCGGRGSGAAGNVLHSAKGVTIVALGDIFQEKVDKLRKDLAAEVKTKEIAELGNTIDLPADRCFTGLDAFEKVINSGANYIILATPPGFRPIHLQAAVAAGKNIFTEKPVAVDGPGIRKVLQCYDDAQKKGLYIVAGTQRRHQAPYIETIKKLHDGAIGDIVGGRCHWNQGNIWFRSRKEKMTDLEYQINNWYHFLWLCGDHIVEQHVHNIDVINWALKAHPKSAVGMGGRFQACKDPNVDGQIYNFFSVDLEYPNEVHVLSTARQIAKCENSVSEAVVGTKGSSYTNDQMKVFTINGQPSTQTVGGRGKKNDAYVQEHTDLIACIRAAKPINELKRVAESTLTAIMSRMSAYTGQKITWEMALNSKMDTMPAKLDWHMSLSASPVPVPGTTKFV